MYMKFVKLMLSVLLVWTVVFSTTKDDVAENIFKKKSVMSFAYKADVLTKTHVQNTTIADSGYIIFIPPDCYKVKLHKSKIEMSILGDTTWTSMPDGSINRKIGNSSQAPVGGALGQSFSTPDIANMLRQSDFTIIKDVPGKYVTIEFEINNPVGGRQKAQATYELDSWLLRNFKIIGNQATTVETGYSYTTYKKQKLLSCVLRKRTWIRRDFMAPLDEVIGPVRLVSVY